MYAITFTVLSLVLSFLLLFPARRILAHLGAVDRPNARSSHSRPVVRGGGAAVLVTICVMMSTRSVPAPVSVWILLAMAGALGIVSFIDDLKSVGAGIRFGCHFVAAVVVLVALGLWGVTFALTPGAGLMLPVAAGGLIAFLWIAGYTNAFNFMDGINGLAAGQAAITAFGMALLAGLSLGDFATAPGLLCLAIGGATLGFLPHNFPRARVFMGDVGSAPLGFLLAVLVLWLAKSAGWWLLVPLALLHANFVLDTGVTLLRRIARGERWHEPHREHFYQRLLRSGKSHTFVTSLELAGQVVVVTLMVAYLRASIPLRILLISAVIALWSSFFLYCELAFRKSAGGRSEAVAIAEATPMPAHSVR